jgi:hypothetical protein
MRHENFHYTVGSSQPSLRGKSRASDEASKISKQRGRLQTTKIEGVFLFFRFLAQSWQVVMHFVGCFNYVFC